MFAGNKGESKVLLTCEVTCKGKKVTASADADGVVRIWDTVSGVWTTRHRLTPGQERHVRGQTMTQEAKDARKAAYSVY